MLCGRCYDAARTLWEHDTRTPKDADGDAVRRVICAGSDLTQPMEVDFFVAVPDLRSAEQVAAAAAAAGFRPRFERDAESGDWTCYCSREMVLTYAALTEIQ